MQKPQLVAKYKSDITALSFLTTPEVTRKQLKTLHISPRLISGLKPCRKETFDLPQKVLQTIRREYEAKVRWYKSRGWDIDFKNPFRTEETYEAVGNGLYKKVAKSIKPQGTRYYYSVKDIIEQGNQLIKCYNKDMQNMLQDRRDKLMELQDEIKELEMALKGEE